MVSISHSKNSNSAPHGAPEARDGSSQMPKDLPKSPAARVIYQALQDSLAQHIQGFSQSRPLGLASYTLVTSGRSSRHVKAIAHAIEKDLKDARCQSPHVEGHELGQWVILVAEDIIVHIFQPTMRAHYNLESLWGEENLALQEQKKVTL